MLELRGAPALSAFRHAKLLAALRARVPEIETLHAEYVHFVDHDGDWASGERAVLDSLLAYGAREEAPAARDGHLFLVVPRLGTISPWSSKATDIAHNCGLTRVRRIERGVAYRVTLDGVLSEAAFEAIIATLHDRMTESVLANASDAAKLFAHRAPAPLGQVDVLGGGRAALETANGELGLALADDEIDYLRRGVSRPGAQSERRRADDVRAGQLRALPAQDLQRRLGHRRRGAAALAVRDDQATPMSSPATACSPPTTTTRR